MVLSNFEYPDLVDLVKCLTNFQQVGKNPEKNLLQIKWFYQLGPLLFWSRIDIHQPVSILSLPNAWHAMLEKPANNCF